MTETLLVCFLSALLCGVGFWSARGARGPSKRGAELGGSMNEVASLAEVHHSRQSRMIASFAALFSAILLVAFGVAFQAGSETGVPARTQGLLTSGLFVVGAGSALLVGGFAARFASVMTLRVADAVDRSVEDGVRTGIRGAMVVSVVVEAASMMLIGGGFAAFHFALGKLGAEGGLWSLEHFPSLSVGVALGACVVGVLLRVCGAIRVPLLGHGLGLRSEERGNQAGVAAARHLLLTTEAWSRTLGTSGALVATGFSSVLVESVMGMLVASLVFRDSTALPSASAVVALPLVIRIFCVAAGGLGALVVRSDDTEPPATALRRGFIVTCIVAAVAVLGAITWLIGTRANGLGVAVLCGPAACLAIFLIAGAFGEHRNRPARRIGAEPSGGRVIGRLAAWVVTADAGILAIVVLAVFAGLAFYAGDRSGLAHGGAFALALAVCAARGVTAYLRAMVATGDAVDSMGLLESIEAQPLRRDRRGRTLSLSQAALLGKSAVRVLDAVTSAGCAILLMFVFSMIPSVGASNPGGGIRVGGTLVGAVLGLLLVLAFCRVLVAAILDCANECSAELRYWSREADERANADGSSVQGQATRGALAEAASRVTLRGLRTSALVGIVVPFGIAGGLRMFASGDKVPELAQAVVALVSVAAMSGGLGSLLLATWGSTWDHAKAYIKSSRNVGATHGNRFDSALVEPSDSSLSNLSSDTDVAPAESSRAHPLAATGDLFAGHLDGGVGPSIDGLVETLALTAVAVQSFFY